MKKYFALLLSIMMIFQSVLPWNISWALADIETPTDVEPTVTEAPTTQAPADPTAIPTEAPADPTASPTEAPADPTAEPTEVPNNPTMVPTQEPTAVPETDPTQVPTEKPTATPEPAPLQVALNADANFIYTHTRVEFELAIKGGVAPYTIDWKATLDGKEQTQGHAADVNETSYYYIEYAPSAFGSHTVHATGDGRAGYAEDGQRGADRRRA